MLEMYLDHVCYKVIVQFSSVLSSSSSSNSHRRLDCHRCRIAVHSDQLLVAPTRVTGHKLAVEPDHCPWRRRVDDAALLPQSEREANERNRRKKCKFEIHVYAILMLIKHMLDNNGSCSCSFVQTNDAML